MRASSKVGGKVTHPDSNAVLKSAFTLRLCGFKKTYRLKAVSFAICPRDVFMIETVKFLSNAFLTNRFFLTAEQLHNGGLESLVGIAWLTL